MGIMDNEGHDPMGFGNVRSALPMQADPDPHGALKEARAEIARLREQLSHEWPAIEELTKEREMYRMRWLGSMTKEDAALIRAENERMRHPFRNVDAIDWRHLMSWIPDSGHGKFWKEVFSEIRLAHEQDAHK